MHASKGQTCPSTSDFEKVLSERMKVTSLRRSSLGPHKAVKILWCANEATKDLLKSRMKKGTVTASVSQDAQGATVGVRMCFVGPQDRFSAQVSKKGSLFISVHYEQICSFR